MKEPRQLFVAEVVFTGHPKLKKTMLCDFLRSRTRRTDTSIKKVATLEPVEDERRTHK